MREEPPWQCVVRVRASATSARRMPLRAGPKRLCVRVCLPAPALRRTQHRAHTASVRRRVRLGKKVFFPYLWRRVLGAAWRTRLPVCVRCRAARSASAGWSLPAEQRAADAVSVARRGRAPRLFFPLGAEHVRRRCRRELARPLASAEHGHGVAFFRGLGPEHPLFSAWDLPVFAADGGRAAADARQTRGRFRRRSRGLALAAEARRIRGGFAADSQRTSPDNPPLPTWPESLGLGLGTAECQARRAATVCDRVTEHADAETEEPEEGEHRTGDGEPRRPKKESGTQRERHAERAARRERGTQRAEARACAVTAHPRRTPTNWPFRGSGVVRGGRAASCAAGGRAALV